MDSYIYPTQTRQVKSKEIVVQGIGILDAKADMAILTFELETENSDPLEAEKANQKMISFAENYMNKYGIKEEDYSYARDELKPIYDKSGKITSYKASTMFRVKFYDINSITEFLYNIKGRHVIVRDVTFTLQDPKAHYQHALEKAVQGANNTVKTIARELKVTYDPVPFYIEETSSPTLFYEEIYQSSNNQDSPQTGFITITANVLAKYYVTGMASSQSEYTPMKPPKQTSSIQQDITTQQPTSFDETK